MVLGEWASTAGSLLAAVLLILLLPVACVLALIQQARGGKGW